MKPTEQPVQAMASLEEQLLQLLVRQTRRVPILNFLASLMIAALAYGRVPTIVLAVWLAVVAAVLIGRRLVLDRLASFQGASVQTRLRIVTTLSLMHGLAQGLSLGFFPFLSEVERALQSMVIIGMCSAAVATSAGYLPMFLAFVVPMLVPLSALWVVSPGIAQPGWIERSIGALAPLVGLIRFNLSRDSLHVFRESFAMRLREAELNRQLQAALDQAEAASRAKTRFLASASHDLRQPIHTLSLFGAALAIRPLDRASREIAEHMNAALQSLAAQLDELLDISKLDAGVMRVTPSLVSLRSLLDRICKEFETAARSKGLSMNLDCPLDGVVEADQALLERIIRNLLDNAIKYTDGGGVRVQVSDEQSGLVITIADSGRGIPESEQARVFEEFYQLDNPERDRTRGLGLGLAIVKRLTSLLQIRMEMRSDLGRGTTFTLLLPHPMRAAGLSTPPVATQADAFTLHALVVDDEAGIRLGMKTLLEAMGCRATLADGTQQAVAAAQADKPDIVLSDLRLRGQDSGIVTVKAVRNLYPRLPAILISGDIAPDRLREAEAAGILLLHKPVPVEILKQAIAKVVSS